MNIFDTYATSTFIVVRLSSVRTGPMLIANGVLFRSKRRSELSDLVLRSTKQMLPCVFVSPFDLSC